MERSQSANNNKPTTSSASSLSSSFIHNKRKSKHKISTTSLHQHQPNSLSKGKESKILNEINSDQLQSSDNVQLNNEASTNGASNSFQSKIHQRRQLRKERRSQRKAKEEEKKRNRKKEKRSNNKTNNNNNNNNNLGDELRHYFGLAIKNSLGHMHNHIIATLPDEMSLYYQKLHDTLLLDVDQNDNENSNSNMNSSGNRQMMNEMHEFVTASSVASDIEANINKSTHQEQNTSNSNNSTGSQNQYNHVPYNPYAPPINKPGLLPMKDFFNDPFSASLNTLNRVTNLVRVPTSQIYSQGYNILNNLASPVNIPSSTSNQNISRPPGTAERVIRKEDDGEPVPPPALPLIQCTNKQTRLEPLDSEEFESKIWTIETLRQRVFQGGISEKLRLHLWPYILGLYDNNNDNVNDDNIDFQKEFDWSSKQKLYEHYRSQWQSILPEQEKRFMLFRERKSLIERDVIRSDRTHPFYHGDNNENLNKLKEILLTYMMYNFDTGYVQGMSDLVSPLLYVAKGDTCKAFWFFVQTMEFTNNNFEMSQLTIKHQLEMLWKLIEFTDPIFAQYLANNESINCYFAFRWIVCQFKREFMKSNSDDYQEVLLLWESIWTCTSMKKFFKNSRRQQKQQQQQRKSLSDKEELKSDEINNDQVPSIQKSDNQSIENSKNNDDNDDRTTLELADKIEKQCKITDDESDSIESVDSEDSMSTTYTNDMCRRLSDTELYVLCICLSIIRRERDLIMVQRFDATEILKHFNMLQLNSNLKNILIHAANIWSWLIFDENEKLLYALQQQQQQQNSMVNQLKNSNEYDSSNNNHRNQTSPSSNANIDEDFDLLQDLRLPLNRSAIGSSSPANVPAVPSDDYLIFS